jgi:spermidine synthase
VLIYFRDGKLLAEYGKAKIYELESKLYLEIGPGHNLWAHEDEYGWYKKRVYPHARGDVLEIGLGLGVCSRLILSNPNVVSLTTVEINSDVIEVTKEVIDCESKKWSIINEDGKKFLERTTNKYDLIFVDTYIRWDEDAEEYIKEIFPLAKEHLIEGGRFLYWFDG